MKRILLAILLLVVFLPIQAENDGKQQPSDYKTSPEYLALRDSMHHAFNNGDSIRFFRAVKNLQDYLLSKNDIHAYYTQRCNEIVFQINRQNIFEAYKLARELSQELRERKLDSEMYMAYNMLGHLNRYCGNKEAARRNFHQVLDMMEKAGYYESMPPIYMNLVNVEIDDNPEEARRLIEKAAEIAAKYSPERVFDIETRKTLTYFNSGDIPKFLEGYKKYREGVAEGKSSVHGRVMEVYYEACMGNVEKAIELAEKDLGDESGEALIQVYEMAGRWKDAYQALREETAASDSINNVVLMNSMQGYRDELRIYDMERESAKARTITLSIIIALLLLLIMALCYIMFSHRRHMKQLTRAYEHALESDKMKATFIKNMSHEVRTPLNVIAGFAQVLANPDLSGDAGKRKDMAQLMLKNTRLITNHIDTMLELSVNEASGVASKEDNVIVRILLTELLHENEDNVNPGVSLVFESDLPDNFCIMTNKNMLKRMVNALLDNATKNTTKGQITLKASADDKNLTIVVEDTGSGIPAAEAEHIFERFFKIDAFKSGLGLGLPLCRMIANRLEGDIHLDTSYQQGARFIVTLPL